MSAEPLGDGRPTHADVVIIGAGFAGIGLGMRLRRAGHDDFVILERAEAVGGTWRDNTYPGVACDIPAQLYSYSFRQKADWSRVFAPGAEINTYLSECVAAEGLEPSIHFGTESLEARWDARQNHWRLTTSRGDYTARVLVTAAGRLSEPKLPTVDGLETFAGPRFHTAAWDHSVDLAGKRVGVVGTGASAVQLVPQLAAAGAEVVVFQRSAPYVIPRGDRAYTPAEREFFAGHPQALDRARADIFRAAEAGFAQKRHGSAEAAQHRERALGHLERQVRDPALRRMLTPDYEIGCKRVLISDDYYPALGLPTVTLEPSALGSVAGIRATAASGAGYDLDVLVFATGFETTELPFSRIVIGRSGGTLAEHWKHGMSAFASTSVHGFPNLYIVDGPLASLGHNSAVEMIETQIEYILGALAEPAQVLEVSAEAEREYTAELDRANADTVWVRGGCSSWYLDPRTGRQTLLWPGTARAFRDRNSRFDPAPYAASGAVALAPL
ncbi:flavin-containing monooxygenase [Subtercola endophyticus]|uniref:flavin-containing monooxygenase n=1 Tax=Subtercola endophyticus TaxID=2895559 RepID=UPI001E63078D|nr:NAD(P)/FAD-dependent oxidoreductase [Subtercola endophyticus]UFS58085.1 NAD(P)/FAD-dependent oxidoreductase [Subtercola endophyticus]